MPSTTFLCVFTYGTECTTRKPCRTSISKPSSRRRLRSELRAISFSDIENDPVLYHNVLFLCKRTIVTVRVRIGNREHDRFGRDLSGIRELHHLQIRQLVIADFARTAIHEDRIRFGVAWSFG